MSRAAANTPLIEQYLDIKARHPYSILFFRVGDFYEMFFEDAEEGSRLLGITLTSRNNGGGDVPLAGVPAKAIGDYRPGSFGRAGGSPSASRWRTRPKRRALCAARSRRS